MGGLDQIGYRGDWLGGCGVDSIGSGLGPVAGFCERGYEPLGSGATQSVDKYNCCSTDMSLYNVVRNNVILCRLETSQNTLKTRAFWDIAQCSLAEVDRRFRRAYCLHHQGDRSSETSVSFYQTARCNNSKDGIFILDAVRTWDLSSHLCLRVTINIRNAAQFYPYNKSICFEHFNHFIESFR
jgi:hypothetical protein